MNVKKILFLIGMILGLNLQAQHRISGSLSPAEDFKWLIAYKLNSPSQTYTSDSAVINGDFTLNIPKNSPPGVYRIVYALPQEEYYFDVIYNSQEDIELTFDRERGLEFQLSEENIVYRKYVEKMKELEQKIHQLYANNNSSPELLEKHFKQQRDIQKSFEQQSKGLISEHFIKANKPYNPISYQNEEKYLANKKKHYFDLIDFKDPILQESGFISDKVQNYVFNTFPAQPQSAEKLESELKLKIKHIAAVIGNLDVVYKTRIMNDLWNSATKNKHVDTANFIFNRYLRNLAIATNNTDLINNIETYNRLQIGAPAPEVVWENEGTTQELSKLSGAEYYVLVFWSSQCSHCLNELPKLHQGIQTLSNTEVLAIGLEEERDNWKMEAGKLPNFMHGVSLGKWDSKYVKIYNIQHTPTYFILDKEKRILAKPDNYEEVIAFLKGGK